MSWGPDPVVPVEDFVRAWFPSPPDPVAPQHSLYWRAYHDLQLAARLSGLSAAMSGLQYQEGVLSARLAGLAAAMSGEVITEGDLAARLAGLRAAMTNIIPSDLSGRLGGLRSSLSGEQIIAGTLSGRLAGLRANMAGTQTFDGQLAAALSGLYADLSGGHAQVGQLAATLPRLRASMAGGQSVSGALAARLAGLRFAGLATHSQDGTLTSRLSGLRASAQGSVRNAVVFDNSSDGGSGGTTSRTWQHNNQGNCIVVLQTNSTSTAPSCTYGGMNIPRVYGPVNSGTVFPANGYASMFALVSGSLPQGNNNVVCTNSGTASAAGAISWRNAGSIGTVIGDNSSGAINEFVNLGDGAAAVIGYGGGGISFGALTPFETLRYGFSAFVTWPTVMGYGLDLGSGITFVASQSSSKAGAIIPILPP